jgi:hypothetical protein
LFFTFEKSLFPFPLFLILLLVSGFTTLIICTPIHPWARHGAQFEYEGRTSLIVFYDKSMIPEVLLNLSGLGSDSNASFLSFNDKINVHLSIFIEDINNSLGFFKVTLRIGSYSSTRELFINLTTRKVTLPDGTLLGQTIIWIPPCGLEARIPYVGRGNLTVFAKAEDVFPADTVQGVQDVLALRTENETEAESLSTNNIPAPSEVQSVKHFFPRTNYYDADTFIMIDGNIDEDAFLSAFNIVGFFMGERFMLKSTNVDLGPPNLLITLLRLLPYIILVAIILAAMIYFVFVGKKKGRKP